MTEGMRTECLWDADYHDPIYHRYFFTDDRKPDSVAVTNFYVGNDGGQGKPVSFGYKLASYLHGMGRITLSTLDLVTPSALGSLVMHNLVKMGRLV